MTENALEQGSRANVATAGTIPRASLVVRAFSSPHEASGGHPVLVLAANLGAEHQACAEAQRIISNPCSDDHVVAVALRAVHDHGVTRTVLAEQIDVWAAEQFGESSARLLHTEDLGQLVDRLAVLWAWSRLLAEDDDPAARDPAKLALHRLGELCIGYDDLVTDLLGGRRRLPIYQALTMHDVAA
jgi:mRNA-degrading endonuclease toxin of MazEF toxin-antitoxin module